MVEAAPPTPKGNYLSGLLLVLATLAISLATFMTILDYAIANVALPYIAGDLGISTDQGVYVITSFAVGNAIGLAATGFCTKRIGLIRLTVSSILLFCLFSWACGVSFSIQMLVFARFLQGLAAGPLIPASQTLIIALFPPKKQGMALAFWTTVAVVGPVVGPILGGWLSYDYSWPWIFFINIPVGLFSALIIHTILGKKYETPAQKVPLDWLGLLLLAIGVSALQFLLDKGEQFDWWHSPIIIGCGITTVISFAYFVVWQTITPNPLVLLRLLKFRTYTLSLIYILVAYACYFGIVVLIPLWLQRFMGYTAPWAGWAVAPLGIIPLFFSGYVGKMTQTQGPFVPLFWSFLLFSGSSFASSFFITDITIEWIAFTRLLVGFGVVFFFIPIFALMGKELSSKELTDGAGFFHFIRSIAVGIGTACFTTLWSRRIIFHHFNLISTFTPSNLLVRPALDTLEKQGYSAQSALALSNELVDKQAAVLALNDCSFFMGWLFIALMLLLLLAKRRKPQPLRLS